MLNPYKTMPVGMEINILIGIIFALILMVIGATIYDKKHPDNKKTRKVPTVLLSLAIIAALLLGIIHINIASANNKGMQYIEWEGMTLEQINKAAKVAPTASETPDKLSGAIVILYKFGCPHCESVYPKLTKKLEGKKNVYFVPSDSKLGQKLVKQGKIAQVPTGVYIRKKALANGTTQNNAALYAIDKKGKPILNENALDRLLLLQEQRK